jgi:hypothetical protein
MTFFLWLLEDAAYDHYFLAGSCCQCQSLLTAAVLFIATALLLEDPASVCLVFSLLVISITSWQPRSSSPCPDAALIPLPAAWLLLSLLQLLVPTFQSVTRVQPCGRAFSASRAGVVSHLAPAWTGR